MATDTSSPSIWLVGRHQLNFKASERLLTKRDVLAVFIHHHSKLGKTIRASSTAVAEGLLSASLDLSDQTSSKQHIITKIERVLTDGYYWKKNRNNKAKRSVPLETKETRSSNNLESLFNTAHSVVQELMGDAGIEVVHARQRNEQKEKQMELIAYQLTQVEKKEKTSWS